MTLQANYANLNMIVESLNNQITFVSGSPNIEYRLVEVDKDIYQIWMYVNDIKAGTM